MKLNSVLRWTSIGLSWIIAFIWVATESKIVFALPFVLAIGLFADKISGIFNKEEIDDGEE